MTKNDANTEIARLIAKFQRDIVYAAPELHGEKYELLHISISAVVNKIDEL